MVIGEYKEDGVDTIDEVSRLALALDDVETDVAVVATLVLLLEAERLVIEGDDRIEGVSKDSRALGSSSFVYLPIDGRWMTCVMSQ
jgi:hypothetical protein